MLEIIALNDWSLQSVVQTAHLYWLILFFDVLISVSPNWKDALCREVAVENTRFQAEPHNICRLYWNNYPYKIQSLQDLILAM